MSRKKSSTETEPVQSGCDVRRVVPEKSTKLTASGSGTQSATTAGGEHSSARIGVTIRRWPTTRINGLGAPRLQVRRELHEVRSEVGRSGRSD